MKKSKLALFQSVVSLLLCISMLLGTTFAWFTDSVTTGINTIAAGNLDVELYHSNAAVTDEQVGTATQLFMDLNGNPILWEPGVVSYENLRVTNEGDLALAYQLAMRTANENHVIDPESGALYGLSQILKVGVVENGITATDRAGVIASVDAANWTTLADFLRGGSLLPEGAGESEKTWGVAIYWEPGENDNYWNLNNGKQLDQGDYLMIDLGVSLIATQEEYESDAFGTDYDNGAKEFLFPEYAGGSASATVVPDADNKTSAQVTMSDGHVSAVVPAGVQLEAGVTELKLTVTPMNASGSNITQGENEDLCALDVHIEGVAANNTVPMIVDLGEVMPVGLNMGNYKVYHVEGGASNAMTLRDSVADFDSHNQFTYDPATGNVKLYMASFSEVALTLNKVNAWKGDRDYSWYSNAVVLADGDSAADYVIANADQLAAFSAIVGGMDGKTQDSFSGKTVTLISDINLGYDGEGSTYAIFYPIGYNSSDGKYEKTGVAINSSLKTFEGTFDGQGHTISNFYQNTWEMKGDNNYYDASLQYYRDGMGLFGKVYGGTVKNLTVDNFSSDGEYTTTGVIAAYADGATFQNIAITNCNPRVYNIGNGGIVGCVGWYATEANLKTSFQNITVDNSNKISALWGSYDVACGGIVGQYYPTSGQTSADKPANGGVEFTNCHIAAQMDVYNDVCGNYQYYAYRYAGMLIGSVRENVTIDGHVYPKMDGITASDCTVHFGTWNDYYYCEFEKNGHPSYSGPDDYKFSRVPNSEIDTTNGKENATCIGHNHTAAENNQAIYLPFNNLVTGYGWGVTTKVVGELEGVTILDRVVADSVEKFETKFTGNFLYRVGTQNAVNVGSLFTAKGDALINSSGVYVTITSQHDDNIIMGSFTAPTADNNGDGVKDWKDGQIKFDQTGIVKVTIQDYDYCTPTVLYLEVVDAKNITSATSSTDGNSVVLLNDVTISSGGTAHYNNCTVYGNGFTYNVSGGMNKYNSKQGHGIIMTKNARIDNLVVIGEVYDTYGAYTDQEDYTSAFDASNTTFENCYIANCSTPIRGNAVTITNTTLYGGTIANLILSGGTNTLTNVTTVNYNDADRDVVGLGILISDGAAETTKLTLNGYLKQYNYVCKTDISDVPGAEAQSVFNSMFDNAFSAYHIGNPVYVNTGIIFMTEALNTNIITDNANTGYLAKDDADVTLTVSGLSTTINGAIYSQPAATGSVDNNYVAGNPEQGDYLPTFVFDLGVQMLAKDNDDDTRYLIGDENGLDAMYPKGESAITLDLTKLATVTKYGISYDVSAKCIGPDGAEQTGTVTIATKGTYRLVFTVEDNIFYDANGDRIEKSVTRTYEVPLTLDIYEKSVADATITISSSDLTGEYVTSGVNKKYKMYPLKAITSIMDDANKDGTLETFNFKSNIQSAVLTPEGNNAFSNATTITVTYTGGQVLTIVLGTPSGLNSPGASNGGKTFSVDTDSTNGIYLQSDGAVASSSAVTGTWPITSWSFKGTSSKVIPNNTQVTIKFTKPSCVTPDTLVTLADGSQKRIDQVTYEDQLLVWDFFNGCYTTTTASVLFNHGLDEYTIIKLKFDDGTVLKMVEEHEIFDVAENRFVYIDANNVDEYVGHEFVRAKGNGYTSVKLVDYEVYVEETEAYTILTTKHFNAILENMFTLTPDPTNKCETFFRPHEVGDNMKYDAKKVQDNIRRYGLYTYADFAMYMTRDEFDAFGISYAKFLVGKGYITYEDILNSLSAYAPNH